MSDATTAPMSERELKKDLHILGVALSTTLERLERVERLNESNVALKDRPTIAVGEYEIRVWRRLWRIEYDKVKAFDKGIQV